MQRSVAVMVGAGLPLWYARELFEAEVCAADEAKKPVAAIDKITIGLVGCGGQGRGIMRGAKGHENVEVVAVCDVDKNRREETIAKDLKGSKDVKAYEDYRELCDNKDINAVLVGTPDHWHTLVAIDAMRKGKDVYCEKPLTLTIAEGKALVKVAKATKAIFQVGTQQRSDSKFRLACELVRNGRLGKIKTVETRIGNNPRGGPFKTSEPPEGLNWDFWLGPTPKVPYIKERCHYEFRWWYDYSGGKMTDWGAHHNDIAQWALGMDESGPVEVESFGVEPSRDSNSYNCHPRFLVNYKYANGARLLCSDRQLPNSREDTRDNGALFVGEDGRWIFVERGMIMASDQEEKPSRGKRGAPGKKGSPSKLLEEPLAKDAVRLYHSGDHMRNFLDGMRTRKPCICPAEVGHHSVTVCHIGVISLRLGGKKLVWDPAKEQFTDDEANKMLSRPYRGDWKLDA
jgi:predicted dehydrogenase